MKKLVLLFALLLAGASSGIRADEGMWLPSEILKKIKDIQSKGFKLSAEDIYSVNKSSLKDAVVRFGGGCTGELISSQGLLITNHHCGFGQIQSHSSVEHDYLRDGFWAMSRAEELPNPGLSVAFLEYMIDVTDEVLKGYKPNMTEEKRTEIINKNAKKIEEKAVKGNKYLTANVRPIYYGNQYFLFVYKNYTDVRLVGAPPSSIGKFGGDTDNWMWPRHTGDFSLFRVYAGADNEPADYNPNNVPFQPKKHFKINAAGIGEGDFTMVYGFPGRTNEYLFSDAVKYTALTSNPHKIALRTLRLDIQKEAGVSDADLVVALTQSDELNIFACMVARKNGARETVARVRNPDYSSQIAEMKEDLGISLLVNPEKDTANEIFNLINLPSIVQVEQFAKNRVYLVEIIVDKKCLLVGETLYSLSKKFVTKVLVCAVQRNGEVYIPSGSFLSSSFFCLSTSASSRLM